MESNYLAIKTIRPVLLIGLIILLTACAKLPDNTNRKYSLSVPVNQHTDLYSRLNPQLRQHPGESGFQLLGNNLDAFTARIAAIRMAGKTIDAQYYSIDDELTGKLFLKNLLDAADRGVRVRLLIDDLNTKGRDAFFAALGSHKNMQVRTFNPFPNRSAPLLDYLHDFKRLDRRMHNKSMTVDDIITVVGGRNIGDKYFSASSDLEFGDLDLLGIGPVSRKVSKVFDHYWNDPYSYSYRKLHIAKQNDPDLKQVRRELQVFSKQQENHVYIKHIRKSDFASNLNNGKLAFEWGRGEVFYDHPRKVRAARNDMRYSLAPKIKAMADKSAREIVIFSPYFIPKNWGEEVFTAWKNRGVNTSVLTNALASTDVAIVHSGYSPYRKGLLRRGVKLYELKPNLSINEGGVKSAVSGLHAKSFIFDRNSLFVGSMNLDPRSVVLNTEMGILIHNNVLAANLARWFDENIERMAYQVKLEKNQQGLEQLVWLEKTADGIVRYRHDPKTGLLKRWGVGLLSILPIQDEL